MIAVGLVVAAPALFPLYVFAALVVGVIVWRWAS